MGNAKEARKDLIVRDLVEFCFRNQPRNAYSVFLCGGAGKEASKFRFALGKAMVCRGEQGPWK